MAVIVVHCNANDIFKLSEKTKPSPLDKFFHQNAKALTDIPKKIPKWLLQLIPFPGEDLVVISRSNPHLNPNAVEKHYEAPTKQS